MKYFVYALLFLWNFSASAESLTKVIVAVKHTKLNNKNKPVDAGYFNTMRGIKYRLKRMSDGKITSVRQKGKVMILDLPEGDYCFSSKMHDYLNDGEYLPILNPICFTVFGSTPTNTGTWLIGHTIGRKGNYALILDHEGNYDELARKLSIEEFNVSKFAKPNQ